MTIEVLMPALSPTMTEGNLVKWHKKEGDVVSAGDMLAEIETDKATMEVEAVDEGILGKILVAEGQESVQVNTLIALLLEEGEDATVLDSYQPSGQPSDAPGSQQQRETTPASSTQPQEQAQTSKQSPLESDRTSAAQNRLFATPLAKRLAAEKQIPLQEVTGSGPYGRIVKKDIDTFTPALRKNSETAQVGAGELFSHSPYQDMPLSSMRKVIAKRLSESKQTVPHFYLSVEAEIDTLLDVRQHLNNSLEQEKLTVNDFVIKAVAQALQDVPEANTAWQGESIRFFKNSDISVAVALEDGLITPIVKAANLKSLRHISREVKELVTKAKAGALKPDEFQGGTMSISNLGMFGIESFQAIVNPPQGCILAVGAGIRKPVVKGDLIVPATVMNCTLSVDHRGVDGKVGALLLGAIKKYLEAPILMLA